MYLRTGRRMARRSFARSRTSQLFWCDAHLSATVTAGTPQVFALDSALNTDYSARKTGATVLRVVGDITAVPTVAAAATSLDTITAGWIVQQQAILAATIDPASATGRQMKWMHQENWIQPFAVAPVNVASPAQLEARRCVDIRRKARFRDEEDALFLAFSSGYTVGGTQVWAVQWHLRCLIRVP